MTAVTLRGVHHVGVPVRSLDRSLAFYRDLLGFELQAHLGTAVFLSAGGYHHHVALNIWKGPGVGPAPPHTVGLRHWTVELDPGDVDEVRARLEAAGQRLESVAAGFRVRDPWNMKLEVSGAPRTGGRG
jgi:catechol 2,3-dioxygenase